MIVNYRGRQVEMSKFRIHLIVFWTCIKLLLRGKMPPKALRRWAQNIPTDIDIAVASKRLERE